MIEEELIIKIDQKEGIIKIFSENCSILIEYNLNNYQITKEIPNSDCEDFNDNARWITKTILEIIKMEKTDENAHMDWTADYEKDKEIGKYMFITKILKINE